jgi:ABC-2 type transport system permease protein
MAMCVAATVGALLLAMSVLLAHAGLGATQMLALFATDVLGVLPFCALGLLVGSLLKGQGAPGLLNMVYLPMAFLSGLWFPLTVMPEFLQQLAPAWPSYHLNALALSAVGLSHASRLPHVLVLAGFTVGFLLLAARRLRRHG